MTNIRESSVLLLDPLVKGHTKFFNPSAAQRAASSSSEPISMLEISQVMKSSHAMKNGMGIGIATGFIMKGIVEGIMPTAIKKAYEELNNMLQKYWIPMTEDLMAGIAPEDGGMSAVSDGGPAEGGGEEQQEAGGEEQTEGGGEEQMTDDSGEEEMAEGEQFFERRSRRRKHSRNKNSKHHNKHHRKRNKSKKHAVWDKPFISPDGVITIEIGNNALEFPIQPIQFLTVSSSVNQHSTSQHSIAVKVTGGGASGMGQNPGSLAVAINKDIMAAAPKIVEEIVQTLTAEMATDLHNVITENIRVPTSKIVSERVTNILVQALPLTLTEVIPTSLTRVLPPYLVQSISNTLTATLTRSLTHSLTPTLYHTLTYTPSRQASCYECQVHGIPEACQMCVGAYTATRGSSVDNGAIPSPQAVVSTALYYSHFMSSYYSDYYVDYYTTGKGKSEGVPDSALPPDAATGGDLSPEGGDVPPADEQT